MGILCYVSLERQQNKDIEMRKCTIADRYSVAGTTDERKIWAEILFVSPYCINTFVGSTGFASLLLNKL